MGDSGADQRRRAVDAWRWLVDLVRHDTSLQDPLWHHGLTPYVLSIGGGSCGDNAVALSRLWQRQGLPSRVWQLDGHIVPEVLLDGRWEVYDPDLDIAYLDRAGRIAGVAELADDPSLVTRPERLAGATSIHALLQRHATPTARAYAGTSAHRLLVVRHDDRDEPGRVPPGTSLRLGDDAGPRAADRVLLAELGAGTFRLPMVLLDARGAGEVVDDGSRWQVDAVGPMKVRLLANPRVWVPGTEGGGPVVPVDQLVCHFADAVRVLGDDRLDLYDEADLRRFAGGGAAELLERVRAISLDAGVPPADAQLSAGSVAAFASAAAAGRGDEVLAYVRSAVA